MKDKMVSTQNQADKPDEFDKWILLPLTFSLIVLTHYVVMLFIGESFYTNLFVENNVSSQDVLNNKGLLGDLSSGHFTFLAFIWMTYAVFIQRSEYKLQRLEFKDQTEEFRLQRQQFEEQNLHSRYNRLHNLLNEIYYNTESKTHKGLGDILNQMNAHLSAPITSQKLPILFKFMEVHHFIENELNTLLYKSSEKKSDKHTPIVNLKKEFILQWKDVYTKCLETYLAIGLFYALSGRRIIQSKFIDPLYKNIEMVQAELAEISGDSTKIKIDNYIKKIDLKNDIGKYFNMEYLDYEIHV